jgi:hypothetical protein
MIQSLSPAGRIQAAEEAVCRHRMSLDDDSDGSASGTEADAQELLQSLALWAEINGYTLRIPKPVYAEEGVPNDQTV